MRTRSQGTQDATGGTQTEPQPEKATVVYGPKDRVNLGVGMPFELKQMIEAEAVKANKSGSAWARDFLADHFNYTLPEGHKGGGKKKYATEEEREAAREAATARRAAMVKVLMSRYGDNPEIEAEVQRVMEETAAKKAAEAAKAEKEGEPASA